MFVSDWIRVSDRIRLNPYLIHIHSKKSDFIHIHLKKSDFIHIHIHYPVNGFFYYLTGSNRVENPRIRTHLPSLVNFLGRYEGLEEGFFFFFFGGGGR